MIRRVSFRSNINTVNRKISTWIFWPRYSNLS